MILCDSEYPSNPTRIRNSKSCLECCLSVVDESNIHPTNLVSVKVVLLEVHCPPHCRICCRFETRSEEHTSELQSHSDLVCRLLLEKKKKKKKKIMFKLHT